MVGSFGGKSEAVPGAASAGNAGVSGSAVLLGAAIDDCFGGTDGSSGSCSGICADRCMVCYSVYRDAGVRWYVSGCTSDSVTGLSVIHPVVNGWSVMVQWVCRGFVGALPAPLSGGFPAVMLVVGAWLLSGQGLIGS